MREERTRRASIEQKKLQASGKLELNVPSTGGDRKAVTSDGVPFVEDQMAKVTDFPAATKDTNEDEGDYEKNDADARAHPTAMVGIGCKESDETF